MEMHCTGINYLKQTKQNMPLFKNEQQPVFSKIAFLLLLHVKMPVFDIYTMGAFIQSLSQSKTHATIARIW